VAQAQSVPMAIEDTVDLRGASVSKNPTSSQPVETVRWPICWEHFKSPERKSVKVYLPERGDYEYSNPATEECWPYGMTNPIARKL
jgi:hypothetical protein